MDAPKVTDLAVTIPTDQIRNAGEPVFPVLREYIKRYVVSPGEQTMLDLVDRREQFGIAKYGQTLMSDDGRDTPTEITNELLDALVYITKWRMQNPGNTGIENLLRFSVASTAGTFETIIRESEGQ